MTLSLDNKIAWRGRGRGRGERERERGERRMGEGGEREGVSFAYHISL